MTDTVFIRGLKASSVIGCYDWERDIRQTLVIDLELKADFTRAAQSDALEDALDYAAISQRDCCLRRVALSATRGIGGALGSHRAGGVFDRTFADDDYQARCSGRGGGSRRGD